MIAIASRWVWKTRYTIVLGILLSAFVMDGALDRALRWYDRAAPIVEMQGKLIHTDGHSTLIHITGKKMRDCKFVRINAYYQFRGNGMLVDAFLERMAGPIDGATKPVGEYDLGMWRIWPTDDATKVLVYVHHECCGPHPETVLSKIAEVPIERSM